MNGSKYWALQYLIDYNFNHLVERFPWNSLEECFQQYSLFTSLPISQINLVDISFLLLYLDIDMNSINPCWGALR